MTSKQVLLKAQHDSAHTVQLIEKLFSFPAARIASKIKPMPWPATHVLVAEKVLDNYFSHLDRQTFIIRTCFPDIRYPAKVDRGLTHHKNLSLTSIQEKSAFQAGLSFHSLVDGVWNRYVQIHSEALFSVVPHNRAMLHTLKVLQDKALYSKHDRWDQVAGYFTTVLPEERTFSIDESMLQRWHEMLAYYFRKPPSKADLQMLSVSLPRELVKKICDYYQTYENQPIVVNLMKGFYTQFEALLTDIE